MKAQERSMFGKWKTKRLWRPSLVNIKQPRPFLTIIRGFLFNHTLQLYSFVISLKYRRIPYLLTFKWYKISSSYFHRRCYVSTMIVSFIYYFLIYKYRSLERGFVDGLCELPGQQLPPLFLHGRQIHLRHLDFFEACNIISATFKAL